MTNETAPLLEAATAKEESDGKWTLIFTRRFNHSIEDVWDALTIPEEVDQWAPYTPSRPLTATGEVTFTQDAGGGYVDTVAFEVTISERPRLLEYTMGQSVVRWELTADGQATSLTVQQTVPEAKWVSMGAAGWHICFDVLEHLLDGNPVGKRIGKTAMQYGWRDLNTGYASKFGTAAGGW